MNMNTSLTKLKNKAKLNLNYFTSRITEIPGPFTEPMKQIYEERKNETIHKRYDNNLRKILYESTYQDVSWFIDNIS